MKKAFIGLIFLITLLLSLYSVGKYLWMGRDTMSIKKVCDTWGSAPLDTAKSKSAPTALVRAKMACSLLKNQKQFYGKDTRKIRRTFGDYTGHYFSDTIPTYIIGKMNKKDENTWQLVFFRNRHGKVVEIVVHQNCCDAYRDGPKL